ncbi:MAG TPA: efflux transporter outer membrane subunit [Burkholderiaceae bacterium]|jgi:multidrug efflux system outer membrane protein|nr:efflux transporter outer membrane subunit [Burkholderiaceae bacterium]
MRRTDRTLPLALCVAALGLCACTAGPDYRRPELALPAQYHEIGTAPISVADTAWWQSFQDPVLDQLVGEALANNRDIAIAAARVEQFYGALRSTRSGLFPQVGAELNGTRARFSENTGIPTLGTNPRSSVQADLFASWEIDLFGRLRRQTEAARADLLASEEARRGVVLSVVAGVVDGYVSLRDADQELEVSRRTLSSRSDALELFDRRYKGGVVSEMELNQARSEYAFALGAVPDAQQRIVELENLLSVLVGRNPGPVERGRTIDELVAPPVPAGLPSELLERRPDLRQAEQAMIAANARIGAARALYYPSISLTGMFGYASHSLSDLFNGPSRVWSYAGAITAPIFTAGGIAGQVQSAEGAQREAQAGYQKAIQNAFQDTENALSGVKRSAESLDALRQQVDALRTYARLARLRYDGGYTSYLEVLDSERSLFNAELQLAQSQAAALSRHIALYKALGGGWVDIADQNALQPVVKASETPRAFP